MNSFGVLPNGKSAEIWELKSETLTVRITNYGARLVSVIRRGVDLVCGPKTLEGFIQDSCYSGAICGRVANRIALGCFSLDGEAHKLAVNNPPNHLHGGVEGFDRKLWTVQDATDRQLVLTYSSPDREENYPGNVEVVATYYLEGETLYLEMSAYTDSPTIINLTNHCYWNLAGQGLINDHKLEVRASAYTPVDATNIPDGRILPVKGTPFDWNTAKPLTACLDHNFCLPNEQDEQVAAVLTCPATQRKLVVATDAPGLQVYTGEYLPVPRSGVALEAQGYPNAVNIPHFPSVTVRPGQSCTRRIAWTIV